MNKLALAAVVLLGVGCLFHIVGLSTVGWATYDNVLTKISFGLWKQCIGNTCFTYSQSLKTGLFQASEAFAILGMVAGLAALFFAAAMLAMEFKDKDFPQFFGLGAFIGSIVAAVFIMMGVIFFAVDYQGDVKFGYSYGLCITAAFITLGGGILNHFSR